MQILLSQKVPIADSDNSELKVLLLFEYPMFPQEK